MSLGYTQTDIQNMILAAAIQKGVPPALALAVAQTESSFNPNAVSGTNSNGTQDYGVFQINSANFSSLGLTPISALDPTTNIDAGVSMLAQLYNQYNGNLNQVLWAYNAGPGAVASGNLPASTATYIPTVLGAMDQFSSFYPDTSTTDISGATDSTGTVSILGYDVPTTTVLAGGIGLAALLWLWLR